MRQENIEIYDAILVHQSVKAYLIRYHYEEFWIPISQVSYIEYGNSLNEPDGKTVKEITRMVIPEWIAKEKKLI